MAKQVMEVKRNVVVVVYGEEPFRRRRFKKVGWQCLGFNNGKETRQGLLQSIHVC